MNKLEKDLKKVEENFKSSKEKAKRLLGNREKANRKIDEVFKKATKHKGKFAETWEYMQLFLSIARDFINGGYKEVPIGSIIAIVGSLLYFLSPIDLIPDFIPAMGHLDDIFVLGLVFNQVKSDLDKYQIWKNAHK